LLSFNTEIAENPEIAEMLQAAVVGARMIGGRDEMQKNRLPEICALDP
jgi:hypothetical protein